VPVALASKQDYYAEFNKHMIPCVITVAQYLCSLFCSRFHLLLFMPLGVAVVLLRSILLVQSIYVLPLDLTHMQKIAKNQVSVIVMIFVYRPMPKTWQIH